LDVDNNYPFTLSQWIESIHGGGTHSRFRAEIIGKTPGMYLASMIGLW
jgi:hypothetical protein